MISRRDFGKLGVAAMALSRARGAGVPASSVSGVKLGVITGSFHAQLAPVPGGDALDALIAALKSTGISYVELDSTYIRPGPPQPRVPGPPDPATDWRLKTPINHFKEVRKRLSDEGVEIFCYSNPGFNGTDQQLDRAFEIADALGVNVLSAIFSLKVAARVAPFADRHRMFVTLHNHDNLDDPYEINAPATFREGLAMSRYFKVNLDVGHFRAAGCDSIAYLKENHHVVTHLHLKDRQKDHGPTVPFGTGDAPLKDVLRFLRDTKYPIPAAIEYEYNGSGTSVEEVKKCYEYSKQLLAG
jgi:sugar phosphate isomerase/epimerase